MRRWPVWASRTHQRKASAVVAKNFAVVRIGVAVGRVREIHDAVVEDHGAAEVLVQGTEGNLFADGIT